MLRTCQKCYYSINCVIVFQEQSNILGKKSSHFFGGGGEEKSSHLDATVPAAQISVTQGKQNEPISNLSIAIHGFDGDIFRTFLVTRLMGYFV